MSYTPAERAQIRRVKALGAALHASDEIFGDPLPSAGQAGVLSGPGGAGAMFGALPMVMSRGVERYATYRMIYLTNPWVWALVNTLSRGIARCPLGIYQPNEDGDPELVRSDLPMGRGQAGGPEALDAALRRPLNSSRFAFWNSTMVDRLVYGNALWGIEQGGYGSWPQVRRIRWRNLEKVDEDGDGGVNSYRIGRKGTLGGLEAPRDVLSSDVVHFGLNMDPESAVAPSSLESCRYTLALHEAIVRHLIGWYANRAHPSGSLKVEKLTRDKAREIREMIEEAYASPENAGKILVTSGEWTATQEMPQNSEIVALIGASREELAAAYAVPPPIVGILDKAIKANVKELREQYVRDGLGSYSPELEDELVAQLLPIRASWRSCTPRFDLDAQLRPDLEARATVYKQMEGMLSIDQRLRMEGLPPLKIPGVSDVPWAPPGAQPISAYAGGQNPMGGAAAASLETRILVQQILDEAHSRISRNGHDELEEVEA